EAGRSRPAGRDPAQPRAANAYHGRRPGQPGRRQRLAPGAAWLALVLAGRIPRFLEPARATAPWPPPRDARRSGYASRDHRIARVDDAQFRFASPGDAHPPPAPQGTRPARPGPAAARGTRPGLRDDRGGRRRAWGRLTFARGDFHHAHGFAAVAL